MSAERCPYCGAKVKKGDLNRHVVRVHPSRIVSPARRSAVAKTRSFSRNHKIRNAGIVGGIVLLSIVMIAVILTASNSMSGMSSNPGPAAAGTQAQFDYLSQTSTHCSWTDTMIMSMSDNTYIQGACCNGMEYTDYQRQVTQLQQNYSSLSSVVALDPYNIPAPVAKADLNGLNLALTPDQQATFDQVSTLSKENWCCCHCWAWDIHQGMGKILISQHGFSAQQVATLLDLEDCCGSAPGPMNMN